MIKDIFNAYRDAFRQWVRTKTRPKTMYEAEEKKLFWSKCYLISITGAIGVYLYQLHKEGNFSNDKSIPMALRLVRSMNENESVRVVKYVDFKRVSDKTITTTKDVEKENMLKEDGTSETKVS